MNTKAASFKQTAEREEQFQLATYKKMPIAAERLDVWTALAAGVASVTSAVVTMPTLKPVPRVRRSKAPRYSVRGLSKMPTPSLGVSLSPFPRAGHVLSGYTPAMLLAALCPVT